VFLKKLTITNFKTFIGSKELIFSKGYTVLSGPNGSGKSNTLDAILFVLGRSDERLKKTVAEVISKDFKSNKLLADFAEVELVFSYESALNGTELPEIRIARQLRIPASGKSYSIYKLNGKETNLSEILKRVPIMEHNIVKQGEITSRMYETPESRRKLIEKVAGLAQLDPLITESSAKIINAKETLKRIDLLLKDRQARLSKLEKEKFRTLKYRKLERELRKYKALKKYSTKTELIYKLSQIEEEINNTNLEIAQIGKVITRYQDQKTQLVAQIEKLREQKQDLEGEKTKLMATQEIASQRIEEIDQFLDEIKIKVSALEKQKGKLHIELKKLKQNKEKILEKMRREIEEQNKILKNINDLQFEIKNLELTLPRLKEEVNQLDLKRTAIYMQINEKDNTIHQLDSKIQELRQNRINLEERAAEYLEIKQDQSSNLRKARGELRRLESQIQVNTRKIEKYQQEIILNKQTIEKQQTRLRDIELKKVELQNELSRYQSLLKEAKPNYSQAVQRVLEGRNRGDLKGIIGTVIELIEEIKPEYAIAIEAAGGLKLQNIVTQNFEATKKVIEYIKNLRVGKITFYPLDLLEEWTLKPTPNDQKVIGKIIDLIKFDRENYQRVMSNVFKNTLIVQDLDTAKKYRTYRAVTRDGDLVEPGGWVTTRGKFEPRFLLIKEFYRKKIGELTSEIEKMDQLRETIRKEHAKLEKKNQARQSSVEELVGNNNFRRGQIDELQKKIARLELEIQKWNKELDKINKLLLEKKAEEQNAHIQLSKALEEGEILQQEKEQIEKAIAETELGRTEQLIEKYRKEIRELRENHRKFDDNRGIFNEQINQIERNLSSITLRLEGIETRINSDLLKNKEQLLAEREKFSTKVKNESDQIKKISSEITKLENQQKEIKLHIQKIDTEILDLEEKKNDLKAYITEELQRKKIRIELQIQELEEKIQKLGLEIKEDFIIDLEEINNNIDQLELEISALGLIDQQAPEKYDTEQERLTELLTKKDNYQRELEEASKTKGELLTQKRRKFLKTISEINEHLDEIFIKLYGKGHASLVLLDKNHPLESGIDIKVDVGSGTVDFIGTLSGGEKSMVALAFIFAIQKYQSAPIYFLDEIDSYLDDTHCEALGRVIQDLSRESQYIVITPRMNALITYADRIYGVWLQDGTTEIVCQYAEDYASVEES